MSDNFDDCRCVDENWHCTVCDDDLCGHVLLRLETWDIRRIAKEVGLWDGEL